MSRRNFLRAVSAGAAALAGSKLAAATDAKRKPNIIYIMADDLGYGDLSCFGQKKFQTPNIDRLATEGVKFLDYYSGSTVCAPSRCCLMTGMDTGHAYVRGNREVKPEGQAPMPADIFTVPRMLKKAGYVTGMFGKWGLGAPGSPSDPTEHFDEFYGYNCQRQAHNYYPDHLWHNRERVELDGKTYSADLIADAALKFVRANKDKPFFAYLPYTIPHASMQVPEDSVAPFRKKFPQFEDKIGKYAGPDVRNPIAAFAGMVTRMDGYVGKLLALLKELGIDDNTIVTFTSDNGPHHEGGHDPKFFDSHGPLKGFKRDLYEGGIRVPFVTRWPGKIKPGTTCEKPFAMWDFMPTCADIAGIKPPAGIDGISYLPALLGEMDKQKEHECLYWVFYEGGGSEAIRMGDWKGIRLHLHKDRHGPIELYNLRTDIGETTNVADKHPDIVKRIEELMAANFTPSPLWPLGGKGKSKAKAKPKPKKQ